MRERTFATGCSGIGCEAYAWASLGWRPVWFAETAPFPSSVLGVQFPDVPNLGDMRALYRTTRPPAGPLWLFSAGTPCQSFSVAGLRNGMADPRGRLVLDFLRVVDSARPEWVVWENVPGALSAHGGRDFGSLLGALVELGYGCAWRVLDARFFGLAQRRRRLFLVASARGWPAAAAVLLERSGLPGAAAPRGEEGARAAGGVPRGAPGAGGELPRFFSVVPTQGQGAELTAAEVSCAPALCAKASERNVYVTTPRSVRLLTPVERERLQGLPDGYTAVAGATPGLRNKALGNGMAVPVLRWLGRRLEEVDDVLRTSAGRAAAGGR